MCPACDSRLWDSTIAVLSGCVPTWNANKAWLLGGGKVGKLAFRRSRSHRAAPAGSKARGRTAAVGAQSTMEVLWLC